MPEHTPGDILITVIEWNIIIHVYMVNGGDRNSFRDIKPLMKRTWLGRPGHAPGASCSVLMNVSHHKEHDFGGDLNGFSLNFYFIFV